MTRRNDVVIRKKERKIPNYEEFEMKSWEKNS